MLLSLIGIWLGVGLWRLKSWARQLAIAYVSFGLLQSVLMLLIPPEAYLVAALTPEQMENTFVEELMRSSLFASDVREGEVRQMVKNLSGRLVVDLLDTATEPDWLCIENNRIVGRRITNMPGGPNHCYFTGKETHLPDCGGRLLIDLPEKS